jgi:hypothetical protein
VAVRFGHGAGQEGEGVFIREQGIGLIAVLRLFGYFLLLFYCV